MVTGFHTFWKEAGGFSLPLLVPSVASAAAKI